ncbi:MAG: pre-peptidase C-terminal domain-containing protein, partial [Caldilineales bacterium]|nr:pre-peptidase C-terminal domain-containing protein [Caldilineales bacterium]
MTHTRWPLMGVVVVLILAVTICGFQVGANGLAPSNPGPDLTAHITLNPAVPGVGQTVEIKVVTVNQGDSAASSFEVYLYVDPPGIPDLNTPDTSLTGFFGLAPGGQFSWEYNYDGFSTISCNHVVYAWVDRDDAVDEDDETNNIVSIPVCVGVTPTPTSTPTASPSPSPTATPTTAPCQLDAYEPNASCGAAKSILADGVHQMHTLCPVGDDDWVKFTATGGITYTIATSNVGPDGDTVLRLYNQCNEPPAGSSDPTFGNGAQMVFQAPSTGEYFLRVRHHDADYGPAASYELSITAATTCQGDNFEQDNECSAARDVTVGSAAQRRQFCAPNDQDWMKFTAVSGATYNLTATKVGAEANPALKLYDQCGLNVTLDEGQQIEWTAPASKTYYVAAQNVNPAISGPTTAYDFTVAMTGCAPDDFEGDDAPPNATDSLPTGAEQTHDFCPLGDQDWVKFPAVSGQLYVIETYDLEEDADTKICLLAANGTTQLACDDDGGGGLASRLRWTAPSSGDFYVRVENRNPNYSGPTTAYQLAINQGETLDEWEDDGSAAQAKSIDTNGALQRRNFTPNGDQDWVKFAAVAGQPYVMRSECAGGDCDTIMHLVDKDGSTELASNDDYGSGSGSQITYIFPTAGTYYLRVHHYRSNRSGNGTRYNLTVTRNGQTPTPTPTATPIQNPGADSTPPASGIHTLIVTNRERLVALYGETDAAKIMDHLALLADSPLVKGFVIQAENDSAALAAFTAWNNSPRDTALANNVTSAVRNLILSYLGNNPDVEYIVIVGNDRVVPFRRFLDRTRYSENRYQAFVTGNTTIWAACRDNMGLTDDYYADVTPSLVEGREIYVPDFGIGRMPEGPDEIAAFVNTFLAGGEITLNRAVITGYDFVTDAGQAMSSTLASDLGPGGAIDGELMGDWWQATAQRDKQLNTTPRYDVQVINGHASHHLHGAPFGGGVNDTDVRNFGVSDLTRALVYTVGCHSGLNDVGGLPAGLDLAQAYFARGANYVANTGYGWGSNNGLGWTERVMTNYTQALTKGASVTIGKALRDAKQRYFTETSAFSAYDEKALMQVTLYGLPQYRLISGGVLS